MDIRAAQGAEPNDGGGQVVGLEREGVEDAVAGHRRTPRSNGKCDRKDEATAVIICGKSEASTRATTKPTIAPRMNPKRPINSPVTGRGAGARPCCYTRMGIPLRHWKGGGRTLSYGRRPSWTSSQSSLPFPAIRPLCEAALCFVNGRPCRASEFDELMNLAPAICCCLTGPASLASE